MKRIPRSLEALVCFLMLSMMVIQPALSQQVGQHDSKQWKVHDLNRPKPEVVTPPAQVLPVPPPADAVVLFNGNDLSGWEATDGTPTKWVVKDGNMESVAGAGYIQSKKKFGDMHLHVEWAAPLPVMGKSQGRGNSGVFLMSYYEVQVLDSYDNPTYADGQAGAIYGQYPPMVNASRPPGEWQAYDIFWTRPRFGTAGNVISPARVTVIHNGIMIQDNVELWGPTEWLQFRPYEPHADRMPLRFQDHGNPVLFRNVWVRDLEADDMDRRVTMPPEVQMDEATLDRYTGRYRVGGNYYVISREGQDMMAEIYGGRNFYIDPVSPTRFNMRNTAGSFTFELGDDGIPAGFTWEMGGSTSKGTRVE